MTVIVSSCTFQKRLYRNGFYVHHSSEKVKTTEPKTSEVIPLTGIEPKQFEEPITASLDDKLILLPKEIPEDSINDICNDSIWTREGAVSRVKILEVTQTEIKYKRCANINGPTIVVSQHNISKIRYANGMIESYEEVKKTVLVDKISPSPALNNKEKPYDIGNIAGICGIIFLLCGIFAIAFLFAQMYYLFALFMILGAFSYFATWVTSILALTLTRRAPDKYKGNGKAVAALMVVAAYTILVLAFLLLAWGM